MSGGVGVAAAAGVAIAEATKASGVIVHVDPENFLRIVEQHEEPLVVHAVGGLFSSKHKYLMSYRGLAFYTKSEESLPLAAACQVVEAKKIWVPGL